MIRLAAVAATLAVSAAAQGLKMDFSALAQKAKSKTEVNLDGSVLDAAMETAKGKTNGVKLDGVKSVSVHAYEYAQKGEYPEAAIDAIVKQAEGDASWKKIVSSRETDERADIFVKMVGGKMTGLLVVSAEAKEVAVVQVDGSVELASVQEVVKSAIQYDIAALANGPAK